MSLETRVTDLINEITALKQTYEDKADFIDSRLVQTLSEYEATITSLFAAVYVSANGDDEDTGLSGDQPVATIAAAASRLPRFGAGRIHLLSDLDHAQTTTILDCNVTFDMHGYRLTQIGDAQIRPSGNTHFSFAGGGSIATAIYDGAPPRSREGGLFGNGEALRLINERTAIVLGDAPFCTSSKASNGLHDIVFTRMAIAVNPAATEAPRLVNIYDGNLSFSADLVSLPSGYTWGDLVAADADAVLSNVALS